MDEDDDDIMEVMEENGNFEEEFRKYANVKEFITAPHQKVYARSVCVQESESEVFLYHTTDIDGCVVELKTLNAIGFPVRHLTILSRDTVREVRSLLHKHVDLTKYSNSQLKNFNVSVGCQLFYQLDWECWIGNIPSWTNTSRKELKSEVIRKLTQSYLQKIKANFQRRLMDLGQNGIALRTLMKNDLNQIDRMFILPGDSSVILAALQEAIDDCPNPVNGFQVILFCMKFGDKSNEGVSLAEFKRSAVRRVTVHAAINIHSDIMELMWSTSGLQNVVGTRGVLRSCLSFADCGNYQSNLDGRLMDISAALRSIFHNAETLRFVQLYADLPHVRPRTRFHPVSGTIVGGMVYPKCTLDAFRRDSLRYISSIKSNFSLMHNSSCRLEAVLEVLDWHSVVKAKDCIHVNKVYDLIKSQPLLVPFPKGMLKCIREVGGWITCELTSLLESFGSTGNVEATWRAFQLELAAEKLLWGNPFYIASSSYSLNLGPGILQPNRSLTDYLGFLSLEKWTSCMVSEDSIPPYHIWTSSVVLGKKINKSVGMHDVLHSNTFVLGRRLISALIEDLYDGGTTARLMRLNDLKKELLSPQPTTMHVLGVITLNQLVTLLANERRNGPSMVYASLCKLLQNAKVNLESVIRDGLIELGLKHFPAVQSYDTARHPILSWRSGSGLFKIVGHTVSDTVIHSTVLTTRVKLELENRRLVHLSKLKKTPMCLPWIDQCAKKLSNEKLSEEDLIIVLVFVSCIALMMNSWYVDYDHLHALERALPVSQYRLRDLEIQSKLLLSHFNKFKLYRLHWTMNFRMSNVEPQTNTKCTEAKSDAPPDIIVPEEPSSETSVRYITDEDLVFQKVEFRPPTCLPAGLGLTKRRWSSVELEIIDEINRVMSRDGVTFKSGYDLFKQRCMAEGVAFRSFTAFKLKIQRKPYEKVQKDHK